MYDFCYLELLTSTTSELYILKYFEINILNSFGDSRVLNNLIVFSFMILFQCRLHYDKQVLPFNMLISAKGSDIKA